MFRSQYIWMFCAVFALGACAGENPSEVKRPGIVALVCQPELQGVFKGVALGETYIEVRDKVCENAITDTESILECHQSISWNGVENKLVVYYTFDSFGLFEIQADLFLPDQDKTDLAFDDFRTYFDSLYGQNECAVQQCRWTTFSRTNNIVEVTLSKEAFDIEEPFLSINFLEPIIDEI